MTTDNCCMCLQNLLEFVLGFFFKANNETHLVHKEIAQVQSCRAKSASQSCGGKEMRQKMKTQKQFCVLVYLYWLVGGTYSLHSNYSHLGPSKAKQILSDLIRNQGLILWSRHQISVMQPAHHCLGDLVSWSTSAWKDAKPCLQPRIWEPVLNFWAERAVF